MMDQLSSSQLSVINAINALTVIAIMTTVSALQIHTELFDFVRVFLCMRWLLSSCFRQIVLQPSCFFSPDELIYYNVTTCGSSPKSNHCYSVFLHTHTNTHTNWFCTDWPLRIKRVSAIQVQMPVKNVLHCQTATLNFLIRLMEGRNMSLSSICQLSPPGVSCYSRPAENLKLRPKLCLSWITTAPTKKCAVKSPEKMQTFILKTKTFLECQCQWRLISFPLHCFLRLVPECMPEARWRARVGKHTVKSNYLPL